jgi:hypothetical protein
MLNFLFLFILLPAYLDVRSDKSEINWLLVDYEVWAFPYLAGLVSTVFGAFTDCFVSHLQSERSDKLKLTTTGTGGLVELQRALKDSNASYAYARVTYSNDKQSTREKFILIVWIGPGCKIMRKAKVRPKYTTLRVYISHYILHPTHRRLCVCVADNSSIGFP